MPHCTQTFLIICILTLPPGCSRWSSKVDPLPPVTSDYLNTAEDVAYVGSNACVECHPSETESYRKTTHSRAFRDSQAETEPPDAEFTHALSGRTYRVYRQDGQLRHQESIRSANGQQLVLGDYALRYSVGSGTHARTYLIEDEGFLAESPITWFASRNGWAMSPGYEGLPYHPGFARPINTTCINCHSGGVTSLDQGGFQMQIREHAVGCERCHGPGELHVARHRDEAQSGSGPDRTIVHPGDLSRERLDAICAQCHMGTPLRIRVRGRQRHQFRPGHRLDDFEIVYELRSPETSLKVAGHVEHMRRSRCYEESQSMTCVTCHNPHEPVNADERVTYYRNKCLQCHSEQSCGVPVEQRRQQDLTDNCVKCHMPRNPSDIPHHDLNHHRIGIYRPDDHESKRRSLEIGDIVPLHDISHLPQLDRDRGAGLALLELAGIEPNASLAASYSSRSRELLERVRRQGLRDEDVESALARIYSRRGWLEKSIDHAQAALSFDSISASTRIDVLDTLGQAQLSGGEWGRALPIFQQLVALRRVADDWAGLSVCLVESQDQTGGLAAAERAVEIAPHRLDLLELLAGVYQRQGKSELAAKLLERARVIAGAVARQP